MRVRFIASGLLTFYDLSYSKFKLEGLTTITRGVEFLSIGQCACGSVCEEREEGGRRRVRSRVMN